METNELRFTPEMEALIKDQIGFTVDDAFKWVPKVYRENADKIPKELWPVFTLKSKDGVELCKSEDSAGFISVNPGEGEGGKYHPQSGTSRLLTLTNGMLAVHNQPLEGGRMLVSWDHKAMELVTADADGNQTKKQNIKVGKIIAMLKAKLQVEIQDAINERSTLTEEELAGLEF